MSLVWATLIVVLFTVFVLREQSEVVRIFHVLRTASPFWLVAALALGLVIQGLMGAVFEPILRRLGTAVSHATLFRVQLLRHVISTIVPLGGPASTVALVRALNQQGVSTNEAVYASVLNGVLGYISFVLFLIPVLIFLLVGGSATSLIVISTAGIVALVAAMVGGLVLLHRGSARSGPTRRIPRQIASFLEDARAHDIHPADLAAPLTIHLSIDLVGVLMLFACLKAVGQSPSLSTVLAGYAIGTLFLLVTPVFQGLGAVELSMTVVLKGFGIASGAALAAVLLYRAAEVWVPLLFGLSMQASDVKEVRRASAHVPAIITLITGTVTVLAVVSHPFPRRFDRIQQYSFIGPHEFSRTFAVVVGFFLIFLSWSLWRRKRIAWIAAIVLLAASAIGPMIRGHDQVIVVLSMINLILLLLHRDHFRVRSDVPTMRQGVIRFGLSIMFAVCYGTIGFALIDKRAFGTDFGVIQSVQETLRLFFSLGTHGLTPRTRFGNWFKSSLSFVGILSLAYATFSLVRPVVWRRRTLPSDRREARKLIDRWGDSSLDLFKSWDDKFFFFSSNRQGVIAYGLSLSSAVALGDPVATSPVEFQRVLEEFLDFCDANDWSVAFHQIPSTHLDDYVRAGLSCVKIGEEAIVDVTGFSLQGRAVKALRSSINRLERDGYRATFFEPPLCAETLGRLRSVSDEWLGLSGRRERGFTLGRFADEYVGSTPVLAIENAAGDILAFANLIHDGVEGEATIDLMRRRSDIPNGVMDLL
ncbi:MAG TPA: flippase-like domain-containing protein, partial [Nitrolancea sp.]|nr:flippase-like domain-containing protein [Nitrolancea sp.]